MNRTIFPVFLMVISILMIQGCGKPANPDGRLDVSGQITLNGEPIKNGSINFSSADPANAGGAGGVITDGKFLLTGAEGIKPGDYKVKIFSSGTYDAETKQPVNDSTKEGNALVVELIPNEYNHKTTQTFKVEAGKTNVFNLNIEAGPPDMTKGKRSL